MEGASFVSGALLEMVKGNDRKYPAVKLTFKIEGAIRDSFTQKNWERAYNKHDNALRISFQITLKSGRKTVAEQKFVHKAALFWTRNPKIPHRIWVSVVRDNEPLFPLEEEEARSALFDVSKVIDLVNSDMTANSRISAEVMVSWGKHAYVEPAKISSKSNTLELSKVTVP